MLRGILQSFPTLLCAALFLASSVLLTAQESTNATSGAATNSQPGAPPPSVGRSFSRSLTPYEPIYFLMGTYPAAEFQFSLKYQLQGTTNLYFAYTQTSFWDLLSSDPSFYDTDYEPSGFLYFPDILEGREKQSVHLDLQGGLQHESNGKGGINERSLYTLYLQPALSVGHPGGLQFSLGPRAWAYAMDVSRNNADIASYRGYADLRDTLSWKKKEWDDDQACMLVTTYGVGDNGGYSTLKFDFSFSLKQWIHAFSPRIHAQYFTGYGQTLRQYNQYSHGLRVGISLFD